MSVYNKNEIHAEIHFRAAEIHGGRVKIQLLKY